MTSSHKLSTLSDSSSTSLNHTSGNHGLRTQLGHILPKHATFLVHLNVEQLSNVPLVSGEFGVRWKFKNVQSGAGLLSKMKPRSASSTTGLGIRKDRSKDKMATPPEITIHSESGTRVSLDEQDAPPEPSTSALYGNFLAASPPSTPMPRPATPSFANAMSSEKRGESKGMTEWVQLKNYTARWDQSVDVLVQMDIHRETADLLPCELKLVAMQRVVHGDPNAPHQPRLGAIYLNLAEYANQGPVTRRYLLRESKTNATLKITLEVKRVGGEETFKPPPLRKGEIMASVTGILSNNDLYNTKIARNLDMYTRADDEDWIDHSLINRTPVSTYHGPDGQLDFDRLAISNGLRTTENLIDTLFNPVPTANEKPSPFTYYDPDKALEAERAVEQQSIHGSIESAHTEGSNHTSSMASTASDHSSGSLPGTESQRHWWQKMRSSRPSTPVDRTFRPNPRHAASFPRFAS
ncbi:N-terminal C2 in EEIG1 and EHBP1 proteins-domain-containing protein [Cytidiella melzeri]|nr:N-terminal C2 in EEIG1 and EHBP1 proteins-domain-containing protein [Cytidiella melzeri]